MNSTQHGLTSQSLDSLPADDQAAFHQKHAYWTNFYEPITPGEVTLIKMMVFADVQRERANQYYEGHRRMRTRSAQKDFDDNRLDEIAELKTLLKTQPDKAIRRLSRTGDGCRILISRWERLDALLLEGGAGWTRFDGDEAMRLMGCLPDRESVRAADEDIVQAYRHAHRVLRDAPDEVFEDAHTVEMYDLKMKSYAMIEAKYPEGYRAAMAAKEDAPARAHSVIWLRAKIAEVLKELRYNEPRLTRLYDEPDRAEAGDRCALLEGTEGTNYLRYARMHELAFHRAQTAFLKGRTETLETGRLPGVPNEASDLDVPQSCPNGDEGYGKGKGPVGVSKVGPAAGPTGEGPVREISPGASLSKSFATNTVKRTPPAFAKPSGMGGSGQSGHTGSGSRPDGPARGDGPEVPIAPAG